MILAHADYEQLKRLRDDPAHVLNERVALKLPRRGYVAQTENGFELTDEGRKTLLDWERAAWLPT